MMTRSDGTTPAAAYVQALTAGATPEEAYQAAYHGTNTSLQEGTKP